MGVEPKKVKGKPQKGNKKSKGPFSKPEKKSEKSELQWIQKLQEQYEQIDISTINTFFDLPLSRPTVKGLKECGYKVPTDVQKETIKLSLTGRDILGAAHTGSGKTLAFIIPILENLYCKQWTNLDGLGALVITPTRELAYQIFETLRNVGKHHQFSAGLIIGGKDLAVERKRMDSFNIIIGTPGRLLQHMNENPLFDCGSARILVLDEADRCLDMGFKKTMDGIIENLPTERQTLLFSATQTKSVRDLARLSLNNPAYISVHKDLEFSTPKGLKQSYVVCELKDKVSMVWSFIKNHLKHKIIVFFATCKEVKYFFEVFSKLRPGITLLPLYGTLHQLRRMKIYESFCNKQSAVLFATDLAARGLDFPKVNWVFQADCPEDAATYIHRVGRTARYQREGESVLLVLPSEMAMIEDLTQKKVPIEATEIQPHRLHNPINKIQSFMFNNVELTATARRAFLSYVKSVLLMKNKKIFDVHALDTDSFAMSLGLENVPKLRFLQKRNKISKETPANKKIIFEESDSEPDANVPKADETVVDLLEQTNLNLIEGNAQFLRDVFLDTGNVDQEGEAEKKPVKTKPVTRAAIVSKFLKKDFVPANKITFDDDEEVAESNDETDDENNISNETTQALLKELKQKDNRLHRERLKLKRKEIKRKQKDKEQKVEEEKAQEEFSDSDEEPDLSWLPDPDKIYGQKDSESDEFYKSSSEDNESSSDETKVVATEKKRKWKPKKPKKEAPPKKRKTEKLAEIGTSLNVNEAEELAMMLLRR